MLAAESLGLKVSNAFGAEIDPKVREVAEALHQYKRFFSDVCDPKFKEADATDFFFAGWPCQPFSAQGSGSGVNHPEGLVVVPILQHIKSKKPRCFLLENVRGLLDRHKDIFFVVLKFLTDIKADSGKPFYSVTWNVLNARLHGGLPQNRERIFVAGVRCDCQVSPMQWPGQIPMLPLDKFIEGGQKPEGSPDWPGNMPRAWGQQTRLWQMLNDIWERGGDPLKEMWVLNVDNATPGFTKGYSPCITKGRGGNGGHWLSWKQRKMTTRELMLLSGVRPERIPQGFSDRQLGLIIGNSVPIPLLARVMAALFRAAGLM